MWKVGDEYGFEDDFLAIYDGSNDPSTQIEKLSGGDLGSFNISSTGNSLFVTLQSDEFDFISNGHGFFATIYYGNSYLNVK